MSFDNLSDCSSPVLSNGGDSFGSASSSGDDSNSSKYDYDCDIDDSGFTPTQLLSLAIRKRRSLYDEKVRDFRRELLHTGVIQSLCKYLGEGRMRRRRSRRSRHRSRSSKRRWNGSNVGSESFAESGYATMTTDDSGSNSFAQIVPCSDTESNSLIQKSDFDVFAAPSDESGSVKKRAKFFIGDPDTDTTDHSSDLFHSSFDVMECDPFGLDKYCKDVQELSTDYALESYQCSRSSDGISSGGGAPAMSDAVNRAIELTKRRQSADRDADSTTNEGGPWSASKKQKALRIQVLDVEKLNTLIKAVDRAWTLPRRNARREPVGSNFQYKKTCASIYKARFRACQQPGFGIMCFNFCYEQGEELAFKCEDASEPGYCRTNANFDELLSKYQKDPYKTKAYIHQCEVNIPDASRATNALNKSLLKMMSRCYATSICDGSPLLHTAASSRPSAESQRGNADKEEEEEGLASPAPPSLKKSARGAGSVSGSAFRRWSRRGGNSSTSGRGARPPSGSSGRRNLLPPAGDRRGLKWIQKHEERTDDGDVSVEELVTPRYVPFWQQLLVRKRTMTTFTVITTTAPTATLSPSRRRSPPKRKVGVGKTQKDRRWKTTVAKPSQYYPPDTSAPVEIDASEEGAEAEEVPHGPYNVIQPKVSVPGGKARQGSASTTLASFASEDGRPKKKYRLVTDDVSDYDNDAEDNDVNDNRKDGGDVSGKHSASGRRESLTAEGDASPVAEAEQPMMKSVAASVKDILEPPKFTGGLVDITTVEVVGGSGQRRRIATWAPPGHLAETSPASRDHRAVAANPHQRYVGSMEMERVPRRMKESAAAAGSSGDGETSPLAFWNKFQPGHWYHSIHYMTNTG